MTTKICKQQPGSTKSRWLPVVCALLLGTTVTACYDSDTEQAPEAVPPPAEITVSNDTLSVPLDTAGTVSVLNNDITSTGRNLSIVSFDDVSANGGTITHNGDGVFTYMPVSAFAGEDTFNYTVMDPDGTQADGMVTVTVSVDVIPNGRLFYANNCAICHSAGTDDNSSAFNGTDLSLMSNELSTNMTAFGGSYELMGAYNDVPQVNIDELKAYLASL